MPISSLMIYGSCARGDNTESSDVDVLALHSESYYKIVSYKKLNIVHYYSELLNERMKSGNLFCLHLAKEGKIIYDPNEVLLSIIKNFQFKKNYTSEIKEANDLAYVLIKYNNIFRNKFYLNKKLAWCLRTIVIAKSAEERTPVFSTNAIIQYIRDNSVKSIIEAKNSEKLEEENYKIMQKFLEKWGNGKPSWLESIDSFRNAEEYFDESTYGKFVISNFNDSNYFV